MRDRLKNEPFKIAYEAYDDGHSSIWIMNADGSNKITLTHAKEMEHYPQISPDGTKICFTIDTGEADNIHPKDKRIVGERLALEVLEARNRRHRGCAAGRRK